MWGVAYKLADDETLTEITKRLDEREKRFSVRLDVTFYKGNEMVESVQASCYAAPQSGPLFLGQAPLSVMAEQIVNTSGPSGPNLDYVLNLWHFMTNEIGPDGATEDQHLTELVAQCNQLKSSQ